MKLVITGILAHFLILVLGAKYEIRDWPGHEKAEHLYCDWLQLAGLPVTVWTDYAENWPITQRICKKEISWSIIWTELHRFSHIAVNRCIVYYLKYICKFRKVGITMIINKYIKKLILVFSACFAMLITGDICVHAEDQKSWSTIG